MMGIEWFDRCKAGHWWGLAYTTVLGGLALRVALTAHGWAYDGGRIFEIEQGFGLVFGTGMGLRLVVYGLSRVLRWNDIRHSNSGTWTPLTGRWLRLLLCAVAFLPMLFVLSTAVGLVCDLVALLLLQPALAWTK